MVLASQMYCHTSQVWRCPTLYTSTQAWHHSSVLSQRQKRSSEPNKAQFVHQWPRARRRCACQDTESASQLATGGAPRAAVEGDIVMLHYVCRDEDGNVVDTSRGNEEPVTFEVGAGEAVGNPLFQAFDAAVRGLSIGDTTTLEAKGGNWRRDLVFEVPREHPEIERLEGRYKSQGGLRDGMLVELANGETALVVAVGKQSVRLDANNMMAGKSRVFELELVALEPGR